MVDCVGFFWGGVGIWGYEGFSLFYDCVGGGVRMGEFGCGS